MELARLFEKFVMRDLYNCVPPLSVSIVIWREQNKDQSVKFGGFEFSWGAPLNILLSLIYWPHHFQIQDLALILSHSNVIC